MFVGKNYSLAGILSFSGMHIVWLTLWGTTSVTLYVLTGLHWLAIPWLPVSLIGTAVAFYVGFKNNSSYDRLWEARKIWGGIVNDSRTMGIDIRHFITPLFSEKSVDDYELQKIHRRMIYRHLAWIYTLREQLLVVTTWEHMHESVNKHVRRVNIKRLITFGTGVLHEMSYEDQMKQFLGAAEWKGLQKKTNKAAHLLDEQAKELKELREQNLIDDFRHMEIQNVLARLYEHQGKAERIKNYPLPRQYASSSFMFIALFIFLLPFALLGEFESMGDGLVWLTIPFVTIVGWVFLMMELIGDYSENPFEGLGNDIPMMSICRTIEIDLREMVQDQEIPGKVEAVNQVLM